jgi:hypothetical protein
VTINSWVKRRTERALAALALAGSALGCGGASATGAAVPEAAAPSRPVAAGVELTVRTPGGEWIFVGDLRGAPVLLVFLATYDGVSQAALVPLRHLMTQRSDVQIVGVMLQQEADEFADAWVSALEPPFPVGYDPDGALAAGETALGAIETVPTFVILDANGVEVERRVGFQSESRLAEMVDRALSHAPVHDVRPPPLLGQPAPR